MSVVQGQAQWIETTQEDFKDGNYERNLYSSHWGGGAVEFVPRFDLDNNGYMDLFTAGSGNATIYWGRSTGYSPGDKTTFPGSGLFGNCDAADLNLDGYADFVVIRKSGRRIVVYWGSPTGPDTSNTIEIPLENSLGEAIFIADFNKDGFLDIACDYYKTGFGCVFWGSPSGYDASNRTDLPIVIGQHNIEVGDLNRDGWLDIVFNDNPEYIIYWGRPSGFSSSDRTTLPALDVLGPHGLSISDLNGDGFLDIITTAWYAAGSQIFWGDPLGYSPGNQQVLNPGNSYGGSTVADMKDIPMAIRALEASLINQVEELLPIIISTEIWIFLSTGWVTVTFPGVLTLSLTRLFLPAQIITEPSEKLEMSIQENMMRVTFPQFMMPEMSRIGEISVGATAFLRGVILRCT
jgi:hypothetical protein